MKQTAVEWLFDNLNITGGSDDMKALEQAKAIEKEQVIEAYRTGVEEDVYNNPLKTGEQYYNETFKSE